MDIRKLQRAIVDGLEDVKGQNIQVFNTEHLSPLFERVIIASGQSNRQTKALASGVRDAVKSRGMAVLRTEGEENGEWIIVDCGAAVAHIMQPSIRDYYRLEEIWGGKPVKIKLNTKSGRPREGVRRAGGRRGRGAQAEEACQGNEAPRAAPEQGRRRRRPPRRSPPSEEGSGQEGGAREAGRAREGAGPPRPPAHAVPAPRRSRRAQVRSPRAQALRPRAQVQSPRAPVRSPRA